VQIVPKFAATLTSLLLIASSIGVNIARYPQVGQPVEAVERTGAAETANSAPAEQQPGLVETANPHCLPPREIAVDPAGSPQAAAVAAGPTPVEGNLDLRRAAGIVGPQADRTVAILDVRPMVPVASLPTAGGVGEPPAGYHEVQRLPPVEPSAPTVADLQAAGPDAVGPYPATSTP
jgi:hypothetical protein